MQTIETIINIEEISDFFQEQCIKHEIEFSQNSLGIENK